MFYSKKNKTETARWYKMSCYKHVEFLQGSSDPNIKLRTMMQVLNDNIFYTFLEDRKLVALIWSRVSEI